MAWVHFRGAADRSEAAGCAGHSARRLRPVGSIRRC